MTAINLASNSAKPMHILHTIPGRNWGGMEQRTLEQVRWLNDHGYPCWVAAPSDGEPYRRALALNLPVIPMVFDRPWTVQTLLALRRFVRKHRINVIDTHVTRDAKAAMGCHDLCAIVRTRHTDHPLKVKSLRWVQWRFGADHIITVAGTIRQHLIKTGLAVPNRSTWIGGWAEESFFDHSNAAETRQRLRSELGISADRKLLLCVGMLRPDKGHRHLIDAVSLLIRRGFAVDCLMAGSPTAESVGYEAQMKQFAAGLKVEDRVHFLGYREDIPNLMQAADILVLASLKEGQPRVIVQAFASGRPVVAANIGGVPEIVIDGITGWLVPPADPHALANAIATVISDEEGAKSVVANARQIAETTMRFDQRMAETLAAYQVALTHARRLK